MNRIWVLACLPGCLNARNSSKVKLNESVRAASFHKALSFMICSIKTNKFIEIEIEIEIVIDIKNVSANLLPFCPIGRVSFRCAAEYTIHRDLLL